MIQRIAIAGSDKAGLKRVEKATGNLRVLVSPLRDHLPPPGTSVILAAPDAVSEALQAALTLGVEHEGMLHLLADAVACREGIALGSSIRIREHAARFAEAYGLPLEEQYALERAAILRDIGKIHLSNDILLKKNVLSYDEWALVQSHSRLGGDLLRARKVCVDIAEAIDGHHECYDGDGYPDHLEREDIPLLARMLRILDVFCAMTSPRHYRKTVASHDEALAHLRSERGKHFDPELIDVFLDAGVGQAPEL